jgi:hypothetical protein
MKRRESEKMKVRRVMQRLDLNGMESLSHGKMSESIASQDPSPMDVKAIGLNTKSRSSPTLQRVRG